MNQTPWVEVLAILLGPLVGIWVTRLIDRAKEARARRYSLFETLMRTRGLELSAEHIGAINLVPVIFRPARIWGRPSKPKVIEAWERLMDALNDPAWEAEDHKVREGALFKAAKCRMTLVEAVARAVGEALPDKEEHRAGYVPKAWSTQFNTQWESLSLLKQVLSGERSIGMVAHVVDYTTPPADVEIQLESKK